MSCDRKVPYIGTYVTKAITTSQHPHNDPQNQVPSDTNQGSSPTSITSYSPTSHSVRDSTMIAPEEDLVATHQDLPTPWYSIILDNNEGLRKDLSVDKINRIHKHLWWVGRPGNINPLHRQKTMLRTIVITENPILHLVWFDSTIFIKPLPEYLLDRKYFMENICNDPNLYELACGFLLSYSKLILYKSDHKIAIDEGLIPGYMDWQTWCKFSLGIRNITVNDVNLRYRYGELRLGRLNQVYMFCKGCPRGFYTVHTKYNHFFQKNFGWLLLLFAFLTIILTAMQVVIAARPSNTLFGGVSYNFGIISIIIVAIGTFFALALFIILFLWNLVVTLLYRKKYRKDRKGEP